MRSGISCERARDLLASCDFDKSSMPLKDGSDPMTTLNADGYPFDPDAQHAREMEAKHRQNARWR
jgi:hypothetical protein